MEGGREGGMTVIHILIGMFNSNPYSNRYVQWSFDSRQKAVLQSIAQDNYDTTIFE